MNMYFEVIYIYLYIVGHIDDGRAHAITFGVDFGLGNVSFSLCPPLTLRIDFLSIFYCFEFLYARINPQNTEYITQYINSTLYAYSIFALIINTGSIPF